MIQTLFIAASIIAGAFLLSVWVYFGLLCIKSWLYDKGCPNLEETLVGKVVCRFGGTKIVWCDAFLFSLCLWVVLGVISLAFATPIWKFVALAIFVVVGLHATRWAIRIKGTIDKIKAAVHIHKDEAKPE